MSDRRTSNDRLAEALRGLGVIFGRHTAQPAPAAHDLPARLAALEREMQEVRTRVNALFFTVLTVALTDVLMRAVLT